MTDQILPIPSFEDYEFSAIVLFPLPFDPRYAMTGHYRPPQVGECFVAEYGRDVLYFDADQAPASYPRLIVKKV